MLYPTILRAAGGLAETPCRWRVNRPSADLVVDSFQLCFGHGKKKSSDIPDGFHKHEMRVHIRFARNCKIFRVSGFTMRMPCLMSRGAKSSLSQLDMEDPSGMKNTFISCDITLDDE